jgi:GNAT superfamily N-acetyltransferase
MRILTFRELPTGWEASHVLLVHQAFGTSWDPRVLTSEKFCRSYPPFADYVGLCAWDEGRILAAVLVRRIPFRTRHGDRFVAGLGHVATSPDHRRRGLARALIAEVQRREEAQGTPFSLLYTGRSIVAHSLYQELGYSDILDFPRATRLLPRNAPGLVPPWGWRLARATDLPRIEELHAHAVRCQYGFTRADCHWRSRPREYCVLEENRRLRGYARLERQGSVYVCFEAVASSLTARRILLRALERQVAAKWLVLGGSALRDFLPILAGTPYEVSQSSHDVLMARSLVGTMSPEALSHELGTDDPRFAIGSQDFF